MQFWRELPDREQRLTIAAAEEYFCHCPPPEQVKDLLSPTEFDRCMRTAQEQLEAAYELPTEFTDRAKAGLLGTLIMCAATEQTGDETLQNRDLAGFHMLLLKS